MKTQKLSVYSSEEANRIYSLFSVAYLIKQSIAERIGGY